MKKNCLRCKKEKSLDNFYKSKKSPDGHANWCKSCKKEYDKGYYENNKSRIILVNKQYQRENRDKIKITKKKYREKNREEIAKAQSIHYKKNIQEIKVRQKKYYQVLYRERARVLLLKNKHGMSVEDYNALYSNQNGKCSICGTTEPGGRKKNFNIDHSHTTGQKRGLLCNDCNMVLGIFEDNITLFEKAIEYLKFHKTINESHKRAFIKGS